MTMKVASKNQPSFPPSAAFPLLIFTLGPQKFTLFQPSPQMLPQGRSVWQKAPSVVVEGMLHHYPLLIGP